ncbi:hypothetical protein [Phenylobacterium deserti]|uniref:Uncharacterized protein n=1 Tax=Phenylobacterium deserti TaxID=1914756 RepID=A0A328ADI3_9CAUL|nr:hypothetical protein [Phenylobacterium deserti]RAK52645.1 hypothetical protein DJ018_10605 [Phenylobacterium deserti]
MNTRSQSARTAAVAGLAITTLVSASLALVALNAGGEVRIGPVTLMRLAAGYDRRAEPLLAPEAPPPAADRARAVQLSRSALAEFPYDTPARLRIAYAESLATGTLTPTARTELSRSYDLVAMDPDVGGWRVRFALNFAQQLPPELREAVKKETLALGRTWSTRKQLRQAVPLLRDPMGAVWLTLWLNDAEASVTR